MLEHKIWCTKSNWKKFLSLSTFLSLRSMPNGLRGLPSPWTLSLWNKDIYWAPYIDLYNEGKLCHWHRWNFCEEMGYLLQGFLQDGMFLWCFDSDTWICLSWCMSMVTILPRLMEPDYILRCGTVVFYEGWMETMHRAESNPLICSWGTGSTCFPPQWSEFLKSRAQS